MDIHSFELMRIARLLSSGTRFDDLDEGEAYTNDVSKALKKKKKALGISMMKQNYKGKGDKREGRQIWLRFKNGAVIDVWLYPEYVSYAGIVNILPSGKREAPEPKMRRLTNETPAQVADMIEKDLSDWMETGK